MFNACGWSSVGYVKEKLTLLDLRWGRDSALLMWFAVQFIYCSNIWIEYLVHYSS
jgi:hypothetical protein